MSAAVEHLNVIVTGAASGIGRATAARFAADGHSVVGIDINSDLAHAVPILHADLCDEQSIVAVVGEAARRLGGIDVLVNCAGTDGESPLKTLDIADFDRIISVNVRGMILVTREALAHLRPGGRIVNVASELGFLGRAEMGCYCAVIALTRSWARELAPHFRVNAVAPGPTDTPMLRFDTISESLRQEELSNPMGRIGKPEEVAAAILFLASSDATFITGQCINVDGGAAMH
jgi:3-oxoacyl-[acyl-carrier protein] reductase